MHKAAREAWFEGLPQGIRDEIDGYVLQDALLGAVRVITDIGFRSDGIGVGTAQLIAGDRYHHYGDRVAHRPDTPLDLESLARRAAGSGSRIVAIEVIWDGDTVHDWFTVLMAVTEDPAEERSLATVTTTSGRHWLDREGVTAGRLAAAEAAERAGRALAEHLSVPFHFASPDTPDDEAPRWRSGAR
ncbi:hypothetical protein AB0D10_05775 [Kitasatospora sp. NPDC048545]|uniref:hypothetical protein n=1 Tax=Kitasatospora sp. NPDC048545 TaxID=3157208 RepID=UPI0033FB06AA